MLLDVGGIKLFVEHCSQHGQQPVFRLKSCSHSNQIELIGMNWAITEVCENNFQIILPVDLVYTANVLLYEIQISTANIIILVSVRIAVSIVTVTVDRTLQVVQSIKYDTNDIETTAIAASQCSVPIIIQIIIIIINNFLNTMLANSIKVLLLLNSC